MYPKYFKNKTADLVQQLKGRTSGTVERGQRLFLLNVESFLVKAASSPRASPFIPTIVFKQVSPCVRIPTYPLTTIWTTHEHDRDVHVCVWGGSSLLHHAALLAQTCSIINVDILQHIAELWRGRGLSTAAGWSDIMTEYFRTGLALSRVD